MHQSNFWTTNVANRTIFVLTEIIWRSHLIDAVNVRIENDGALDASPLFWQFSLQRRIESEEDAAFPAEPGKTQDSTKQSTQGFSLPIELSDREHARLLKSINAQDIAAERLGAASEVDVLQEESLAYPGIEGVVVRLIRRRAQFQLTVLLRGDVHGEIEMEICPGDLPVQVLRCETSAKWGSYFHPVEAEAADET